MVGTKTSLALALIIALSGCASVPGTDTDADDQEPLASSGSGPRIAIQFLLDAEEVDQGTPVGFTLNGVSGSPSATLDAANATWTILVLAGAMPVMDDEAANGTTDANATEDDGAQTADNATEAPANEPILTLNGTGLPAVGNFTVPGNGTFDILATVQAAGFETGHVTESLAVLATVAFVDPCADFAGPQDPFVEDGSVTLVDDVGEHPFELAPCHTTITVHVSGVGGDVDLFLLDPNGNQATSSESYSVQGVSSEQDMVFSAAGGLKAGTWTVQVLNYASPPMDYTVTATFE